ncbi:MAG: ABC transporter permease [Candidatus Competibacteraceae bacterium]
MNFGIILDNLNLYWQGLLLTVQLTVLSLALGLTLAIPLSIVANSGNSVARGLVFSYSYFFRGTPLLVQIYLIYFGTGQFEGIRDSILWPVLSQAYWCALIAFALNTGAYTTEILRGAIKATPRGEIEAARSVGMSTAMMYRRIILPSAFRRALPAYGNEMIFMLQGTSLASVITLVDLTGAARIINSRYYSPYEAFITAGLLYMALTFTIVMLVKWLERYWFAHLRPREG